MYYDSAQTRKTIKAQCKEYVSGHLGRCIGINVLFALPIFLITFLWMFIVFAPVLSLFAMGLQPSPMQMNSVALNLYSGFFLIIALLFFIGGPLTYGMQKFYIALSRGEEPGVSTLFRPFCSLRSYWTGVKMSACLSFRSWLWMLGPTVVYFIVIMSAAVSDALRVSSGMGREYAYGYEMAVTSAVMPVATVLYFIVTLLLSVKIATYMAGYLLVDEDERRGVWAATREGSRAFKGHLFELFKFYLSFFGWYLLLFVLYLVCGLFSELGQSVLIALLSSVAMLCIGLVLGTFIGAYATTSFYGLFRAVAPTLPRGPVDVFGVPIETAAPAAAPAPAPEVPQEPPQPPMPEGQEEAGGGDASAPGE